MRDEILFSLLLEHYPVLDIEDFKTFLKQFRDHLNSLQPHQCNGGIVLDVAKRPEGPVQPASMGVRDYWTRIPCTAFTNPRPQKFPWWKCWPKEVTGTL
ncbi:hypothetical protein NPIL_25311 [Nephila pilipes]|uniref:Uncharacterized protein n=1 Tax=Nephila pilipes TaxID=299642 RepID=A0A8X6QU12_NEPPI|nr:hypothetical protein NPIL_25311 [Nephila pilipes]